MVRTGGKRRIGEMETKVNNNVHFFRQQAQRSNAFIYYICKWLIVGTRKQGQPHPRSRKLAPRHDKGHHTPLFR